MRWVLGLLALSIVSGCGSSPTVSDGGGSDASCTDECATLGETRCSGSVIEGCAIGTNGCQTWRAGLDCATSGTTCDDTSEPAVCSSGSGTCTDSTRNQDETDVDCGGTRCPACMIGQGCVGAADCESRNCDTVSMTCVTPGTPTCTDRAQNQDETDVDCGGTVCDGCGVGAMCGRPEDCQSGRCTAGRCEAAPGTCSDMAQNQDETDVDCGGATCDPCGIGLRCMAGTDCATGNCDGGRCAAVTATCTDGMQNGTETDVDCGGMCPNRCGDGSMCLVPADCTSGYCNHAMCVPLGTCADGARTGEETDVDCGGPTCDSCPNGRECLAGTDCRSGSCDTTGSQLCVYPGGPTCTDAVRNRDETDVDCGGLYCDRCMLGDECMDRTDCASGACDLAASPHVCIGTTPSYTVDEDFETGDFTRFPYTFVHTGAAMDWSIESAAGACHAGMHCMRTNATHPTSTTSHVELSLSVRENTNISFWVKTNLEPGEHYFRFYVDGVMQREITGVNDWTLVTVPVTATGAGGLNRVFRWEMTRSAFVSPDHTPWYEAWVDDIDMPAWNTDPTVPELVRPTNGQLTTDTTPTFGWRSFDADFDPITYEMQYDTAPSFTVDPQTTGETNELTFTPTAPLSNGIYYWRARAKDNSNYRWSAWSPVYSVSVESGHEYPAIWRQTVREQFQMNELGGLTVGAGSVTTGSTSYDQTRGPVGLGFTGASSSLTFNSTPPVGGTVSATLTITAAGDFNSGCPSECGTIQIDGTTVGSFNPLSCSATLSYSVTDVGRFVNDGAATVTFVSGAGVNDNGCSAGSADNWSARLQYTALNQGTMTSVPIRFSTFEGRTLWEKIHVVGTGTIRVHVLDESGALIPDTLIPGNAAGNTSRTLHLWYLDPMAYPVIRLRAILSPGAVLDEWSVVGNDRFEWTFSHDGDTEGWTAEDYMATPSASVTGGVLRVSSMAAGTDPRVLYTVPRDMATPSSGIDSRRFTRLLVRVRTSNNYNNDDVTMMWSSNFGAIDVRRSFTEPDVFLFGFQDIVFDLTQTPTPPNEAWQGTVYSLRVDPVVRFLNELMQPTDGWFEIERIAIY